MTWVEQRKYEMFTQAWLQSAANVISHYSKGQKSTHVNCLAIALEVEITGINKSLK
jgi:hypothetical protein